jgi:hypothetical protein
LTDIDVVVVRDGNSLKGWMLGIVLGAIGKSVLEKASCKPGQGHRSPERRSERDRLIMSRVAVGGEFYSPANFTLHRCA